MHAFFGALLTSVAAALHGVYISHCRLVTGIELDGASSAAWTTIVTQTVLPSGHCMGSSPNLSQCLIGCSPTAYVVHVSVCMISKLVYNQYCPSLHLMCAFAFILGTSSTG